MLTARREGGKHPASGCHGEIVALRPDERRSLPSLTVALLPQNALVSDRALLERVSLHLSRVRERQSLGASEQLGRRDERSGEIRDETRSPERDRGREAHELAVPERHLLLGKLQLIACNTQKRVPLLEDTLKLAHLAPVSAVDLPEHRVEVTPPAAGC